jgi:betaine lipid synthase
MASLGGNVLPPELDNKIVYAGVAGVFCFALGLSRVLANTRSDRGNTAPGDAPGLVWSLLLFAYGCFLKPHGGDGKGTQQDALESFYKAQAGIYDTTRSALLKGREDMLALVAAQLRAKSDVLKSNRPKRVWVDVRLCSSPLGIPCTALADWASSSRWAEARVGTLRRWPLL